VSQLRFGHPGAILDIVISKRLSGLLAKQKGRRGSQVPVLMLYEDARCGKRAIEVYDALVQRFGGEYDFQSEFCTFDALAQEAARNKVTRNSKDAGLVIVSAQDESAVPAHTRKWLEHWIDTNGDERRGLMTLLDRSAMRPATRLRKLVTRRRVKSFRDSAGLLPKTCAAREKVESCSGKPQSFMDWILTAAVPSRLQTA
jgi:hypothetical protein